MKVEVGESLAYSWLKHVKKCQLIQINWKFSPVWGFNNAAVKGTVKAAKNYFKSDKTDFENYAIFGANGKSTDSQIIQQTECDVIGYDFKAKKIYAVESAFHRDGLLYQNPEHTGNKVASKLIRSAICFLALNPKCRGELYFLAPTASPKVLKIVNGVIDDVNDFFSQNGLKFKAFFYCGISFKEKVLNPIVDISEEVADTSELFLRGIQLCQKFDETAAKTGSRKKK